MQTAIGRQFADSPKSLAIASFVGVSAVAADLMLAWWDHYPESLEGRGVIALVAVGLYVRLLRGDWAALDLGMTPAQGWGHWARMTALVGFAVAVCVAVGLGGWVLSGRELPVYATPPSAIGSSFLRMCVFAPVLEEVIYRLVLCVPLAALLRPWGAIAVSGLAFGGLHVLSGNPSPENLVGGFLLAWAYLKSETIAVPILLHSLGNLCALAGQVGTWYWLQGSV